MATRKKKSFKKKVYVFITCKLDISQDIASICDEYVGGLSLDCKVAESRPHLAGLLTDVTAQSAESRVVISLTTASFILFAVSSLI